MAKVSDYHTHSPEVRETAKNMFPNSPSPSQQQCRWALLAMGLLEKVGTIEESTNILVTFHELGPIYLANYNDLPPDGKKAIQSHIKRHMSLLVTAISRLPLITVVPAPERAWQLEEAGLYPPPFITAEGELGKTQGCVDDLYRPGLSWYGINITHTPDGLIPTAYTQSGHNKGKGLKEKNTERDGNWTRAGLISDKTCERRQIPTQKQLKESELFIFGK